MKIEKIPNFSVVSNFGDIADYVIIKSLKLQSVTFFG